MDLDVDSLNLSPADLKAFANLGISYVRDVFPEDLAKRGISQEEWSKLQEAPKTKTALDLYYETVENGYIYTLIGNLDRALGGGIQLGQIIEFCGLPGSGRTHMCLQLSVNVQLPEWCGGLDGEAFYVYTDNYFNFPRLESIATKSAARYAAVKQSENKNITDNYNLESILQRVTTLKLNDVDELVAFVKYIKSWVTEHKLKLLVIDNISHIFKHWFNNIKWRPMLYTILAELQGIATDHGFAIVVTNDMTTKSHSVSGPCLGDNFYHRINTRIELSEVKDYKDRYKAKIEKHIAQKNEEVLYQLP